MNVSTKSCLWCHISIFPLSTGSQHFSSSQAHKPCLMLLRATFWPSNSPLRHPSFSGATNASLHLWIFHVQWTYIQANMWSLGLAAFDLPNPFFSPIRSQLFTCHPNSTKLEYFQHISQLSKPDLLFQPPGSESNYAGFIFDGNFSKPGLARHQIKWKFVISFKYAKAFRIFRSIQGPKYEQVMKFSA